MKKNNLEGDPWATPPETGVIRYTSKGLTSVERTRDIKSVSSLIGASAKSLLNIDPAAADSKQDLVPNTLLRQERASHPSTPPHGLYSIPGNSLVTQQPDEAESPVVGALALIHPGGSRLASSGLPRLLTTLVKNAEVITNGQTILNFPKPVNYYQYLILKQLAKTPTGEMLDFVTVISEGKRNYPNFSIEEFTSVWNSICASLETSTHRSYEANLR